MTKNIKTKETGNDTPQNPPDGQNKKIPNEKTVTTNPRKTVTVVVSTAFIFTFMFGVLFATGVVQIAGINNTTAKSNGVGKELEKETTVLPSVMPLSVDLPIEWGDLGMKLLETGVIDEEKFARLYESRGGMSEVAKTMFYDNSADGVAMTKENAQDLLNLFWAFGLANKNPILIEGPMTDERYGGDPSQFASTGGWTLRTGEIQDHYNMHPFVSLTPKQQARVETVSKGIFRPCCNNATYFPDCNHGMAMLGLLELLAANDVIEEDMYDFALGVNIYWFPGTYETIAQFLGQSGYEFDAVPAKDILGQRFSSASGFQAVKAALTQPETTQQGGDGCSV